MNYILCSGYTVKAEYRDNKVYLRYKSLTYARILLDMYRYRVNFDVPPGNCLNHSHRNIIRYNPSYGIFTTTRAQKDRQLFVKHNFSDLLLFRNPDK